MCNAIAEWKRRTSVADVPTGPKDPKSTVLTIEEEAIVVAFRRHTLLPLDDCLYALQTTIPHPVSYTHLVAISIAQIVGTGRIVILGLASTAITTADE